MLHFCTSAKVEHAHNSLKRLIPDMVRSLVVLKPATDNDIRHRKPDLPFFVVGRTLILLLRESPALIYYCFPLGGTKSVSTYHLIA